MYETLDEASEYIFDIQVKGAGNSKTMLTVLPGMDMGDIKRSFCDQVGVHSSMVKFSLYSYWKNKVIKDLKDDTTHEYLGMGPQDVLIVDLRFSARGNRIQG